VIAGAHEQLGSGVRCSVRQTDLNDSSTFCLKLSSKLRTYKYGTNAKLWRFVRPFHRMQIRVLWEYVRLQIKIEQ
jgi:hypothetical protein